MKRECDAAVIAVLLAVAVARVEDGVDVFRVERNETQAMGDKFVGENGSIGLDFDEVDGHGGDFGKDDAPEGVGEGEVNIGEGKVYGIFGCLDRCQSRLLLPWFVEAVPL